MAIFTVGNLTELRNALESANSGDEIRLSGGDYGALKLNNESFGGITITSASVLAPATFNEVELIGVSGLNFDNILFKHDGGSNLFKILEGSHSISIKNSTFEGLPDSGGYGTAQAILINRSSGVVVENNDFTLWERPIVAGRSNDITIKSNEISDFSADALRFTGVSDVLVENNYIHDSADEPRSGEHRDMIQFFSLNQDTPSTNITIRGNTFDIGGGSWTETIFIRNEAVDTQGKGYEMFYRDFLIEDNVIYNSHVHGITVGHIDGLTIRNNTLIHVPGDLSDENNAGTDGTGRLNEAMYAPRIKVVDSSLNVVIENNVTPGISGYTGQSSWMVQDNYLIQGTNPNSDNYVGNVFDSTSMVPDANNAHSYKVTEGSIVDLENYGAESLQPEWTDTAVKEEPSSPPPLPSPDSGDEPLPLPSPDSGDEPLPSPDSGGTTSGGDTSGSGATSGGGTANYMDIFGDSTLDFEELLSTATLKDDASIESTADGEVVEFDGDGDRVRLDGLKELDGQSQLSFSVEYTRDIADGQTDRLIWKHTKLGLMTEDDGLRFDVRTKDGWEIFVVDDLGLNDTETHRITVIMDNELDRIQIIVDDQIVLDESGHKLDGIAEQPLNWGWSLGGAWGGWFDGEISDFTAVAAADFEWHVAG